MSEVFGQRKLYYIQAADEDETTVYSLFRLDLSQLGDGDMPAPVLTLEKGRFARGVAFGALGSKIYMVGGFNLTRVMDEEEGEMISISEPSLDVYSLDTRFPVPKLTIEPSVSTPISRRPHVIPLRGKLYVIPSMLVSPADSGRTPSSIQVFDPAQTSWSVIQLPDIIWERKPYKIAAYAVKGSQMILSLDSELGTVLYDVETCKWRFGNVTPKTAHIPYDETGIYVWDEEGILCPERSGAGILSLHDSTMDEGIGEIQIRLTNIGCKHYDPFPKMRCKPFKPFREDARIIEIATGEILVVSRCWIWPFEDKLFQLRLHHLKFDFKRDGKFAKACIHDAQVCKCLTLTKTLAVSKLHLLDVDHLIQNTSSCYCFLI